MEKALSFFSAQDEVINSYIKNGYHIEYDLLSKEECEQIKSSASLLNSAKTREFSPVMMPHREKACFLHYMKNTKVIDILSKFIGGDISGLQSQFFYMKPGTRGFSLHQDNHFVQAKNNAFASAWLALDNTQKDNGGLIVYPGSHRLGVLPVVETRIKCDTAQDPNAYRTKVDISNEFVALNVEVPLGAVLFIHGCLVHASNDNKSVDKWRHVLLNTYIRKGEAFRPGRDAKREEILL